MNQFNYFPCVDTDYRNLSHYSVGASILQQEIYKELSIHKLRLSAPSIIRPKSNSYNFFIEVGKNEEVNCFSSLGELDANVGHLIRSYGNAEGSKYYIGDEFLPFSTMLSHKDSEFKQAIERENQDLQNIQDLSVIKQDELLAFYGISCGQAMSQAINIYKPLYPSESFGIASYVIYNFLSMYVSSKSRSNVGNLYVSNLINNFVRRV